MGKHYSAKQRAGGQFSGNVQQNTTQPRQAWKDVPAKDQARIIKRTGEKGDPAAVARQRNFLGQRGSTPPAPRPPKYTG